MDLAVVVDSDLLYDWIDVEFFSCKLSSRTQALHPIFIHLSKTPVFEFSRDMEPHDAMLILVSLKMETRRGLKAAYFHRH